MADKLSIYGMDQATMTEVVRKLTNAGGPKIGLQFLPFYDSPTEETMWDVVRAVSPMANFRAVDGEAEIGGRPAFDRAYADIMSVARKERLNTSDLRKIREAGMLPIVDGTTSLVSQMGAEAMKKVRAALERSKAAVDNRLEWMQVNALLGKISYTGKVQFSVDYGIPGGQSGVVPANLWSDLTNSTPLKDIQGWQQTMNDTVMMMPDTIIMSRKTLNYIKDNSKLQTVMQYTNPLNSVAMAKTIMEDNLGVTIVIYDSTYTDEKGGGITRFLPANTIIMLPSTNQLPAGVGDTARVGHPLANYTPGYYSWQDTEMDPYCLEIGVGLDAFPRIKHPEALFNAIVW
jgi:hypothetical protein